MYTCVGTADESVHKVAEILNQKLSWSIADGGHHVLRLAAVPGSRQRDNSVLGLAAHARQWATVLSVTGLPCSMLALYFRLNPLL